MLDPQFRRALAYVAPYWRRLVPVVVLSLTSTLASLLVPLLSRALIDDALLAGDREAYTYLPQSAQGFMSAQELSQAMEDAGLEVTACIELALGTVAIHVGQKW